MQTATEFDVHYKRNQDRNKSKCYQPTLLTDDYGTAWFRGQYTRRIISALECAYVGAVVPQVNRSYVDDKILGPKARALSVIDFNRYERNCNSCRHLIRLKMTPRQEHYAKIYTVFYGRCASTPGAAEAESPIFSDDGSFSFSPENHMGMACWQERDGVEGRRLELIAQTQPGE